MKKTNISVVVAMAIGLAATPIMADSKGFYGGFGIGIPDYAGGATDSDDAVISSGEGAAQGFIGYRFNDTWALEAGYADLAHGVDDDETNDETDPEEFHAKALTLSVLGHVPVTKQFSLYGKLGAAHWDMDRKDPDGVDNHDENGTSVVVGLGADYQVNRNMSLRASWDHYHNIGNKSDDNDTANVGVSLIALNLILHGDRAMQGPAALGDGSDYGFYIGGGGGISDFDGRACEDTKPCEDSDNEFVDKDAAWQLFAGYQINSNWAVEAGYTDLGRARNHDDDPSDTFDAQVATLSVIGTLPVTERMALHAKVGGVHYDVTRKDRNDGGARFSDDGGSFTFGIGASYQLSPHLSLRGNYDYYHDLGDWDKQDTDNGETEGVGEAGVSMVSLNLIYHFDPMRRMAPSRLGSGSKEGFYLGLGGGNSQHDGLEGSVSDYDIGKDLALQAFGGYQFNDTWSVELAYVDLGKTFDDDDFDDDSEGAEVAEIDLWSLSVLASVDITSRLSAYAKVGATRWDVERDNDDDDEGPMFNVNDNGSGWTVGLGADYDLDHGFGVRASWDYYGDMGDPDSDGNTDTGEHDAHTYMLSVFKRF